MPTVRIISTVPDYQGEELRPGTVVTANHALTEGWIRNKKAVPVSEDPEPMSNHAIGLDTDGASGLIKRDLKPKGKGRGRRKR